MIRHIELFKISEVHDGKTRDQLLEELPAPIEETLKGIECISSFRIQTINILDPLEANLYVEVNVEDEDTLEEFNMDLDRLAMEMKVAEYADSILTYDVLD